MGEARTGGSGMVSGGSVGICGGERVTRVSGS